HNSLREFIRYQTVHTPNTIIENVFMLQPGHFARFNKGSFVQAEYWKIPDNHNNQVVSRSEAKIKIRELFENSIHDRLVADVEVGAFLSGGIDSSAVTGMMAQVAKKSISTFTVSFDETEYSEARYAEMVAKKFNTNHREIVLRPEEMLHELPLALNAMDHPGGDGPNTYVVSKATRQKGIKVVLTGLGGDELFAGYPVFKNALALQQKKILSYSPSIVKKGVSVMLGMKGRSIANEKIREVLRLPGPIWPNFYSVSRSMFPSAFVNDLVLNKNIHNPVWEYASHVHRNHFHKDAIISYISRCEIRTYMQNVLLRDTDQMTMAHALEARAPFLDHRLVEYVLSLADREKIPVTPKALFVESMGDLLPSDIVNRPKMGFTFPWESWMRNELKTFCEDRINRLTQRDLFNSLLLKGLWERFLKGDTTITWARVWIFVVLEDWLERNGIES
ncbi:MAG: asparagine synthetase B family protein, partial [Flavobacteriales bacterium]